MMRGKTNLTSAFARVSAEAPNVFYECHEGHCEAETAEENIYTGAQNCRRAQKQATTPTGCTAGGSSLAGQWISGKT